MITKIIPGEKVGNFDREQCLEKHSFGSRLSVMLKIQNG